MKIYVTQRLDTVPPHGERRDNLDILWHDFFLKIEITPILVTDNIEMARKIFFDSKGEGLLLTGGNTIGGYEGADAPERDEVESFLIKEALKRAIPIVGVCRGFQFIHLFFGGKKQRSLSN